MENNILNLFEETLVFNKDNTKLNNLIEQKVINIDYLVTKIIK